ncbi:aminoglycoside 6'-N-acetyltransferase [Chromobacterium alticapitis]|uniref:Aminoglycoside N(6')-acetyltransferase type 1 n=1 Tax=Chromobacterium alticapitis TaxID=2073169 RepID=A0A2S5DK85_9NEIS|nr:aminoglycoside 6'-N-acetyltransferase [Chromobacterium alticapitis]POZ63493.1 aminoglycoside 6'-acetyltransferase [Chromobacterium alticapitis]
MENRSPPVLIVPSSPSRAADWLRLRAALWPHCPMDRHQREIAEQLGQPDRCAAFLAIDAPSGPCGLIEIALRNDYVNGTESSPVAFVEGLYVAPEHRRGGVAARLMHAAREWARQHGCVELASDTALDNAAAQAAHLALGFEETERVVFYRMAL